MKTLASLRTLVTAFSFALVAGAAGAQTGGDWQITLAPYVFGSSMDGTIGLRGRSSDVDLSASDIFDDLELGFTGMAVARKGEWGILGDAIYVALGDTARVPGLPPADVDTSLGILTLEGVRRVNDVVDVTFGARYNRVDGEVAVKGPVRMSLERSRDWVDPVVGVVLHTPGDSRWHATLIADVGGFGAGSELTWQAFPSVGYQVTERAAIEVGYRFLALDYEDGDGGDRFVYDVMLEGPAVGVAIRF